MKCFAAITLLVCVSSLARAEPPVPQSQYLPPNQGGGVQQPANNYLPPQQNYQPPSSNYLPPQRGSGAQAPPSNSYGAPIASPQNTYGAPAVTSAIFKGGAGGGGYGGGASAGGYGAGRRDEENYGPAKYEFKYDVQDYESGNDFGHMESRDGDLAVGRYYVLLPDGRKQIVEYEADQNGYRPTIRYEQVGNGAGLGGQGGRNGGGYDSNAQQGKFGGYQ